MSIEEVMKDCRAFIRENPRWTDIVDSTAIVLDDVLALPEPHLRIASNTTTHKKAGEA